jgi:hypothetical protein
LAQILRAESIIKLAAENDRRQVNELATFRLKIQKRVWGPF